MNILLEWNGSNGLKNRLVAHYKNNNLDSINWITLEYFAYNKWNVIEEIKSNSIIEIILRLLENQK